MYFSQLNWYIICFAVWETLFWLSFLHYSLIIFFCSHHEMANKHCAFVFLSYILFKHVLLSILNQTWHKWCTCAQLPLLHSSNMVRQLIYVMNYEQFYNYHHRYWLFDNYSEVEEDARKEDGLQENIGIVVFGDDTRILQPITSDHRSTLCLLGKTRSFTKIKCLLSLKKFRIKSILKFNCIFF